MSIRAYKINKIDHEEKNTFNLWHHPTISTLVDDEQLSLNGSGIIEISQTDIEGLIDEIKSGEMKPKEDEDKKEILSILKTMLKQAKDNNGYVCYYCY